MYMTMIKKTAKCMYPVPLITKLFFLLQLSPIERYAMKFIETTESAWSAEQLAAAEREIEEQKREWEQNRLAAMREEEERRARELEEEGDIITFSREDATNQVSTKSKKLNRSKKLLNRSKNINKARKKLVKQTTPSGESRVGIKRIKNRKVAKKVSSVKLEQTEDSVDMDVSHDSQTMDETQINGETDSLDSSESVSSMQALKQVSNHVDHNSPRTRSRGTVAINLWTLDVSPILPGEKPLRKVKDLSDPTERRKRHKSYVSEDDKSQSEDDKEPNKWNFKKKIVRSKKDSVSSVEDMDVEIKTFNLKSTAEDGQLTEIINKGKVCHVLLSNIVADGQYSLPEIANNCEDLNADLLESSSNDPEHNETVQAETSSLNETIVEEKEVTEILESVEKEKDLNESQNTTSTNQQESADVIAPEPVKIEKETPKENIESNNKLGNISSHLDNGLDGPKKIPPKVTKRNLFKSPEGRRTYRKFGRGAHNKTLDNWVKRSPKGGNVSVNSRKAEDNADDVNKDVIEAINNESTHDLDQTVSNSESVSEVGNSSDSKPD